MRKYLKFLGVYSIISLLSVILLMTACSSKPSSTLSANTLTSSPSTQNVVVTLPSFADLVSAASPSVVQIDISATVRSGRRTVQQQGAGSGWIMDANGTIVTNNHVVAGATTITVTTSDGKTYPANVINTDPVNDLALIKINAPQLKALKTGDASKIRAGDWVLAIGNPLGEGITVVQGIVSRLGVSVPLSSTQNYNDLIETTAPINPGNSGGPLINMSGEVVGITALEANGVQGMGYAINMVDALPIIQKLSK
ncbi:MAG TPA: trypsin-like peptidase domain-containing protein [Dehalococcoidales bacterium]|nr:trypsin-like peptidase domain-containing protein [Dehalococcoidales bacterium]